MVNNQTKKMEENPKAIKPETGLSIAAADAGPAWLIQADEEKALDDYHQRIHAVVGEPVEEDEKDVVTLKGGIELVNKTVTVGITKVLEANKGLKEQLTAQDEKLTIQGEQLKELAKVTEELNVMKAQREEREARKLKQQKRKRVEQNDPLELKHYDSLLSCVGSTMSFNRARLRLALGLLFMTGLRVGELVNTSFNDIRTMFDSQRPFVRIRRTKGGKSRTALLSAQGSKISKARRADYQLVLDHQNKDMDSLIFAKEKDHSQVSREYITREINKAVKQLEIIYNGRFTSHSFRRGYINFLWQNSGDLELVRLAVGHAKVATTGIYVKPLSNDQLSDRLQNIGAEGLPSVSPPTPKAEPEAPPPAQSSGPVNTP
jgi:site-specific recombinase XerD